MKNILFYMFVAIFFLTSCEKVIDLKLKDNTQKLVIEANINDGAAPYFVTLSKTVRFSESSIYPPVTDAVVIISDDAGNTDILTHIGNGKYQTNSLVGTQGRTYRLKVTAEGKTYEATSKMPIKVPLDELKVVPSPFGGDINKFILPVYTDPITFGNNYRFTFSINGKIVKTDYLQINDNLGNGQTNEFSIGSSDADVNMKKGDNISVEMQCIDENVYLYYFTLSSLVGNGGSGATPANPVNNITSGALGVFSAYTTESKSIVIP